MEKINLRRELEIGEECKKTVCISSAKEAREALFLSIPQFCQLLEISEGDYWDMVGGGKQLSHNQKLFLYEAMRIAQEKGLIDKGFDY